MYKNIKNIALLFVITVCGASNCMRNKPTIQLPKLKELMVSSDWNGIQIWDTSTNSCVTTLMCDSTMTSLVFDPKNPYICASEHLIRTVKIWDLKSGTCTKDLIQNEKSRINQNPLAFHPKAHIFASGKNIFDLCRNSGDENIATLETDNKMKLIAFHPMKLHLFITCSKKGKIQIWNWETKECLETFGPTNCSVSCAAFTPSMDFVAIVSKLNNNIIEVWNLETKTCIKKIATPQGDVCSLAFHPTNSHIIAVGLKGTKRKDSGKKGKGSKQNIQIVNYKNGTWVATEGHEDPVKQVVFCSYNPKIVVSCDDGGLILFWDYRTGELINNIKIDLAYPAIAFPIKKERTRNNPRNLRLCDMRVYTQK